MNPNWRNILLAALWIGWQLPFFLRLLKGREKAVRKDRRARWGVLLECLAYFAVLIHRRILWAAPVAGWRVAAGIAFGLVGIALAFTALSHLGRQWRVDAGLNADHELVRTGPYRFVRHPIYASMFCMLLCGVAMVGSLPGAPLGIALFILGTEIRVRAEDGLLATRFGAKFRVWQDQVPAYIPFVR